MSESRYMQDQMDQAFMAAEECDCGMLSCYVCRDSAESDEEDAHDDGDSRSMELHENMEFEQADEWFSHGEDSYLDSSWEDACEPPDMGGDY